MSRTLKQPSSDAMETDAAVVLPTIEREFGEKSFILNNDPNGQQIHEENVRQLRHMDEQDIQDQRKQLMESMST